MPARSDDGVLLTAEHQSTARAGFLKAATIGSPLLSSRTAHVAAEDSRPFNSLASGLKHWMTVRFADAMFNAEPDAVTSRS